MKQLGRGIDVHCSASGPVGRLASSLASALTRAWSRMPPQQDRRVFQRRRRSWGNWESCKDIDYSNYLLYGIALRALVSKSRYHVEQIYRQGRIQTHWKATKSYDHTLRSTTLTEFICKVLVSLENLDEMVKHPKIHGYLCQNLLNDVLPIIRRDVQLCKIGLWEASGNHRKARQCSRGAKIRGLALKDHVWS